MMELAVPRQTTGCFFPNSGDFFIGSLSLLLQPVRDDDDHAPESMKNGYNWWGLGDKTHPR